MHLLLQLVWTAVQCVYSDFHCFISYFNTFGVSILSCPCAMYVRLSIMFVFFLAFDAAASLASLATLLYLNECKLLFYKHVLLAYMSTCVHAYSTYMYIVWLLLSQGLGQFTLGLTRECLVQGKFIHNIYVHISFVHKYLIYNYLFFCWYVLFVDIVFMSTFLLSPQYICPHFICPQTFNLQFFCVFMYFFIFKLLKYTKTDLKI